MRVSLYCQNSISAGISNQAISLIDEIFKNRNNDCTIFIHLPDIEAFEKYKIYPKNNYHKLYYYNQKKGILKIFSKGLENIILIPFRQRYIEKSDAILVFANYSPFTFSKNKIVILRHSYLVEYNLHKSLSLKNRIIEKFRKITFTITLLTTNKVIVQSNHMLDAFKENYKFFNKDVVVLGNPISKALYKKEDKFFKETCFSERENTFLYISRYYPHKNHKFIISLIEEYYDFFKKNKVNFYFTIDEAIYQNLIKNKNVKSILINLGEIPQVNLSEYYKIAKALIFPSTSETFGNALIEAMYFKLPIIVPNKSYAKSICGSAALFYNEGSLEDAKNRIELIMTNKVKWKYYSDKVYERFQIYLSPKEYFEALKKLL